MKPDLHLWRRLWKNGTKGLIISFMVFVASIVALSASIVYAIAARPRTFTPLDNPSPQHVVTPIVQPGGFVTVEAVKCNNTSASVGVEGRSFWRERQTNQLVPYLDGIGVREPGCVSFTFNNPVPSDLPEGIWRLEGIDIARDGERIQQEPWHTDYFAVERGQSD